MTVAARVENAATCQLQLLSKQSFPVVYSHNAKACSSGTFSAEVTIGPNPTTVPRTIAFALAASATSSHADDPFYISLAAGSGQPAKNGVPTTTNQPSVAASLGAARNYQELRTGRGTRPPAGRSRW